MIDLGIAMAPYGTYAPSIIDRMVISATGSMPSNWLGLRAAIALRRIVTMRKPAHPFDVERWGLRVRLWSTGNGCEKNLLFTPQMYEVPELEELMGEIIAAQSRNRIFHFVDIGANVGLFSLFVAAHAGRRARIIAVEPDPENFARLSFNLAANESHRIEAVHAALGDMEGDAVIVPNVEDRGGIKVRMAQAGEESAIQCIPLPRLLAGRFDYIDALKADTEGCEDKILIPFFERFDKEMWPRLIILEDQRSAWSTDLFSYLDAKGYVVTRRTKLNAILRRARGS
ncbi:MAG TPA: FkbM family methyltransferase [Xanthobacteraceae bacterium]